MSLILEALKKSESERRLGQLPGLLSPGPSTRRRHGWWPLLAVLVLAVALSTAITWWLLRPEPGMADQAPAADADTAVAATDGAATNAGDATGTVAATATVATAPPAPAPAPATPPQPAATATVRPAMERESAPIPAGDTAPPSMTAATPATPPGRTTPATPSQPAEGTPRDAAPRDTAAATATTPADSTAAAPAAAAEPQEPHVQGLYALPRDVQQALPPLKLTMHVFNDDPALRFVLIDGRRYNEGMSVADGLLIEAIRRDGVVLLFREHRFLLKRPG